MLYLSETRIPNGMIQDYPLYPGDAGKVEEGMPLVLKWSGNKACAGLPTGGASDQFVGVAYAPRRETTAVGVKQMTFNISSTNLTFNDTHSVPSVNGAQGISVWKTSSTGVVTALTSEGSAPAAGQFQVISYSPLQVLFNSADAGQVTIMFNYTPTFNDVTLNLGWHGEAYGMQSIDTVAMTVPVIVNSRELSTDKFVASDAWFSATAASPLYITSDGNFTLTNSSGTNVSRIGSANAGPAYARLLAAPNNAADNFGSPFPGIVISVNV
jgi:hypothetical protein